MIPHVCPNCNGQGKVQIPPWIAGDQSTYTTSSVGQYPCFPCGGAGIVWELTEEEK